MRVQNLSPFLFGAKVTSRRPPRPEMVAIVRGTFQLVHGGAARVVEGLHPLLAQGALTSEVSRGGEDGGRGGAAIYPDDFAAWKPRADVLLRRRLPHAGRRAAPRVRRALRGGLVLEDPARGGPARVGRRPARRHAHGSARLLADADRLGARVRGPRARRQPRGQGARGQRSRPTSRIRARPSGRAATGPRPPGSARSRRTGPRAGASSARSTAPRGRGRALPGTPSTSTGPSSTRRPRTSRSRVTCAATRISSSRTCTPRSRSTRAGSPRCGRASSSATWPSRGARRGRARRRWCSTRSSRTWIARP